MGYLVQWPISWRIARGEKNQVQNAGGTIRNYNRQGEGMNKLRAENFAYNVGYGAEGDANWVTDVANIKGASITSKNSATSSEGGNFRSQYIAEYWFVTDKRNYAGTTMGQGNTDGGATVEVGRGATRILNQNRGVGRGNSSPQEYWKADGQGESFNYNGTFETEYKSFEWPKEGYKTSYKFTQRQRFTRFLTPSDGTDFNYNIVVTYSQSESGSGTNLAQGHYSGPPFYSTTTLTDGYTIVGSKLSFSTTTMDTVILAPPISACKTKPENFVWIAGGFHEFQPIAYGVAEVLMREQFLELGIRERVNFAEIGQETRETIDNLSVISSSYQVSNVPLVYSQEKVVNGNASVTNLTTPTIMVTGAWIRPISTARNTKNISYNWDEEEDEQYPIISTTETTVYSVKYVTESQMLGLAQNNPVVGTGVSTNAYGNYINSTAQFYPFGPDYYGGTSKVRINTTLGDERRSQSSGTTKIVSVKQGVWTASRAVGFLSREYETSKIGYFYTDPDGRYFNAKGINTVFDTDNYRCYDATCIDFHRYANAEVFQTATTFGNDRVSVKRKSPRDGRRWTRSLNLLSSKDNFKQTATQNAGVHGVTGHLMNTVSPYGDTATYISQGIKESKGIAKYDRTKLGLPNYQGPNFGGGGVRGPARRKGNAI
jgi:hypothetical protein